LPLKSGMVLRVLGHIASNCHAYHLQMTARFSLLKGAGSKFLFLPFFFFYVRLIVWLLVPAMEAF
jgi:hypothetical protein